LLISFQHCLSAAAAVAAAVNDAIDDDAPFIGQWDISCISFDAVIINFIHRRKISIASQKEILIYTHGTYT